MSIQTITKDGKDYFKMYVTNDIEKWRYETFWDKEPETIEWINSFEDKRIFFDVGANIGIYSLYVASLYPDMRIFAFEPMQNNFTRLYENIKINKYKNIIPIYMALHYETGIKDLLVPSNEIGRSESQIIGFSELKDSLYIDTVLSMNIEDFCKHFASWDINYIRPSYLKIDVDGIEFVIINGIGKIINFINSCLVEINDKEEEIKAYFVNNNFTYKNEPLNYLENHSRIRRAREGIKAENVIFSRK